MKVGYTHAPLMILPLFLIIGKQHTNEKRKKNLGSVQFAAFVCMPLIIYEQDSPSQTIIGLL